MFVPSSVIAEGFGASTLTARAVAGPERTPPRGWPGRAVASVMRGSPVGMCLVNSSCPGQARTISPSTRRAVASTGVRSRAGAASSASAAVPYAVSWRRVAIVGGIISSSPRS